MTHYLTVADVLTIAEEIGAGGALRDLGLLDSAVNRPQATVFGEDAYPDLWLKAAALMHSIVAHHPFVDGNKRTAAVVMEAFLNANGLTLEANDAEVVVAILALAGGEIGEEELAAWLRERIAGA